MATTAKQLPAQASNIDPPVCSEACDISASDYTPTLAPYIRGVNASVAGLINVLDLNGVTATEYVNTGWNPCTVCTKIFNASSTATLKKAALAKLTA